MQSYSSFARNVTIYRDVNQNFINLILSISSGEAGFEALRCVQCLKTRFTRIPFPTCLENAHRAFSKQTSGPNAYLN